MSVPVLLFTAPIGYVTILRDILAVNNQAGSGPLNVYRLTGSAARGLIYAQVPGGTTFHQELRQVIPPGSDVYVIASWAGADVSMTGYQFAA